MSNQIIELYRKRAKNYDFTANLYYLIGFREWMYRRRSVDALDLKRGNTVIELGCGTGLNFSLFNDVIGNTGKIIGVDITDAMLDQARKKIKQNGWKNIDLVEEDIANFKIPKDVDGIISTFALTLSSKYDNIIKNGYNSLRSGGRFVILDFKMPTKITKIFSPIMIFLTKPFGVKKELVNRHPWESINKYFDQHNFEEEYGGFVYISSGKKMDKSILVYRFG